MQTCVHPKYLDVQHMGQPCEGMPVSGMKGGERPYKAIPSQSGLHIRIFGDIQVIVVVDKRMIDYLVKDKNCSENDK